MRFYLEVTVFALLLLATGRVDAQEGYVRAFSFGGISYHFDRSTDHCEFNPGIGIQYGGAYRRHAGVYSNSECRFSAYGGFSYTPTITGGWRAGVALLAVTGYHKEKKVNGELQREDKVVAAPMLVLSYEAKHDGFDLAMIPPDGGTFRGVILFSYKILERVPR